MNDLLEQSLIGKLNTFKKKALQVIEVEALKSIRTNFEVSGRPAWIPSKKKGKLKGTKTLVVTGNLSNVSAAVDGDKVVITTNPLTKAYAQIQNEGGTIDMPARTLRFRNKKYKDGSVKSVFASSRHKNITAVKETKPYQIKIPARPFLTIPDEDAKKIISKIKEIEI